MIKIYTDGSCLTNPGDGGWAAIININALKYINSEDQIEIFTDSKYVKNGITEWINTWVLNNWKTSNKEDVKNKDLWIELYKLNQSLNIKWNWVKAHAGDTLNEEVDILAKEAANLN